MSACSREELKQELQRFARQELQQELNSFADRLRGNLREELGLLGEQLRGGGAQAPARSGDLALNYGRRALRCGTEGSRMSDHGVAPAHWGQEGESEVTSRRGHARTRSSGMFVEARVSPLEVDSSEPEGEHERNRRHLRTKTAASELRGIETPRQEHRRKGLPTEEMERSAKRPPSTPQPQQMLPLPGGQLLEPGASSTLSSIAPELVSRLLRGDSPRDVRVMPVCSTDSPDSDVKQEYVGNAKSSPLGPMPLGQGRDQRGPSGEAGCHSGLNRIVDHHCFDYAVGLAIALNAALIGVQTELAARTGSASSGILDTLDLVFCLLFAAELCIRMLAYRAKFFCGAARWWNLFDCVLVGLQVVEKLVQVAAADTQGSARTSSGLSAMRILRILRVIRIIRLVRVLRLIGELRTIVICIISSMQSLAWTVLLLWLVIYVTAVYLTLVVSDYRWGPDGGASDMLLLNEYYGSLFRSIMTLYQSVAGGISWGGCVAPLIEQIHPILGVLFALYIAFVILAIMNVVTGVFVESALHTAQRDKDVYMVHNVLELFGKTDENKDGWITREEFQKQVNSPAMKETLQTIDIDEQEANELFQLLDIDDQGQVCFDDFVNGCLRLRGSAKSIDLMTVLYEQRRSARRVAAQLRGLEASLRALHEGSTGVPGAGLPGEGQLLR